MKNWFWIPVVGAIAIGSFSALSGSTSTSSKIETKCHPSYSGCLKPDASDYDCVGGSGNGPYYTGKVQVIGPDVFGLDRDGDGWGCDKL